MADNLGYTQGSGSTVSTEEVTTLNGGAVTAQHMQRVAAAISTANGVGIDLPGDATNGLDVDVTRVSGNVTVVQATAANLNAAVTGTVTANAGTGSFTVAQATAANLNATVTGTVTANAGTGNFTVTQATAANLQTTTTLAAGTAYAGRVRITDGTNDLTVDTVHNDGESATENHLDVASKMMGLNSAGTFDIQRVNTTGFKAATFTTAQTSTIVWTPTAGKALVITYLQIQSYGTTAGTCIVYFGAGAYARNTNLPLFDGEFAPSATLKPVVTVPFAVGPRGAVNDSVRITTTGAQSVTVVVHGYEI
jgi:hypothetical protein